MIVIAICSTFESMGLDDINIVVFHEVSNPTFADNKAQFPQLPSHAFTAKSHKAIFVNGVDMNQ